MMNFGDYISEITFRFVKPHIPLPILPSLLRIQPKCLELFEKLGVFGDSLEIINTKLPSEEHGMKSRLREICKIPKMSTFAIGAMINKGVSQMLDTQVFVNVGVWHGFTILSAMVNNPQKKCIGVDNFSEFGGPRKAFTERFHKYKSARHYFYNMDYLEYFLNVHEEPIGFYVYDGNHRYEEQLKGLRVAEPFFAKNCIILIDDTNYDEARRGTIDFISYSANKYRILLDRTTSCNSHLTLWNGIMIFQRIK